MPSAVRGIPLAATGAVAAAATGVVPATITVTDFVTVVSLAPRIVSVYVVVAAGFTWRLPLGTTGPIAGSMVGPPGFSTLHTSIAASPGLIDAGRTSNETMRGAGAGPRPPPRPAAGGAAGGGVCAVCASSDVTASATAAAATKVRLIIVFKTGFRGRQRASCG